MNLKNKSFQVRGTNQRLELHENGDFGINVQITKVIHFTLLPVFI